MKSGISKEILTSLEVYDLIKKKDEDFLNQPLFLVYSDKVSEAGKLSHDILKSVLKERSDENYLRGSILKSSTSSDEKGVVDPSYLVSYLKTVAMFSDKNVAYVGPLEKYEVNEIRPVKEYIKDISDGSVLLIAFALSSKAEIKKLEATDFFNEALRNGVVINAVAGKESSFIKIVKERVKLTQIKIEDPALSYIVRQVGMDSQKVENEIEKLYHYLDKEKITLKAAQEGLADISHSKIFDLNKGIRERNGRYLKKVLDDLLRENIPIQLITKIIAKELLLISAVIFSARSKLSFKELACELSVPIFVISAIYDSKSKWDQPSVNSKLESLFRIYEKSVRGKLDISILLEQFLITI